MDDTRRPCASWRVVRYVEGLATTIQWCERVDGPCPYPNTVPSDGTPCAADLDG